MQDDVVMAGFGGQGIMLIGKILAYAGMEEGREVSWLPSYGPEMRGGTANCTVVISDLPIGSPVVQKPKSLVVMNRPSLERFGPDVRPGGTVIINSSLIPIRSDREDVSEFLVPANDIAIELGVPKAANMVILGAYVAKTGIVSLETVKAFVKKTFAHKPHVIEKNYACLERGAACVVGETGPGTAAGKDNGKVKKKTPGKTAPKKAAAKKGPSKKSRSKRSSGADA